MVAKRHGVCRRRECKPTAPAADNVLRGLLFGAGLVTTAFLGLLHLNIVAVAQPSPEEGMAAFHRIAAVLDKEGVAYDIDAYRDAPSGLRVWCGSTVERADVEALTLWLDWAYAEAKAALAEAA